MSAGILHRATKIYSNASEMCSVITQKRHVHTGTDNDAIGDTEEVGSLLLRP